MIVFTERDRQMLRHIVDVVGDRMHHEDGYTEQDRLTFMKVQDMSTAPATVVVVTGEEIDSEARQMFQAIVRAELAHWVPGASQRLLYRAGRIVGVDQPNPAKGEADCGPDRADHALISDWVAGLYLMRCSSCFRLYDI